MHASLPQDPVPLSRVTVHVPRDVAFNIEKMFQITKNVLGRLGCGGCHSGRFLDFRIIEEFVVTPNLEVKEVVGGQF